MQSQVTLAGVSGSAIRPRAQSLRAFMVGALLLLVSSAGFSATLPNTDHALATPAPLRTQIVNPCSSLPERNTASR